MPTKFSDVYERAIFKFTDYSFLDAITEFKEELLQKYLLATIADFQHMCDVDINDYDLENKQFNVELPSLSLMLYPISVRFTNAIAETMSFASNDKTLYPFILYVPFSLRV